MKTITCIVNTGGRYFADRARIKADLAALMRFAPQECGLTRLRVCQGGCGLEQVNKTPWPKTIVSADTLAWIATHELELQEGTYEVNHKLDGPWPAAGPRRNVRMLDDAKPEIVCSYPDLKRLSSGTWNCTREALRRGIPVILWAPNMEVSMAQRPKQAVWDFCRGEDVIFTWSDPKSLNRPHNLLPGRVYVNGPKGSREVQKRLPVRLEGHALLVPEAMLTTSEALEIMVALREAA